MGTELYEYFQPGQAYKASFDRTGRRLAYISDETGTPQAWVRHSPDEPPEQLTMSDHDTTFAIWSPTADSLIVGEEVDGGAYTQFYRYEWRERTMYPIFDEETTYWWGGWSNGGNRFAFASNRRDESVFDVYVHDILAETSELVYEADGWYSVSDWSPDDRYLLMKRTHTDANQDLYSLSLANGEIEQITHTDEETGYGSANWVAADGSVYCVTDHQSEERHVCSIDVADGSVSEVYRDGNHDIDGVNVHSKTGRLVCGVNVEGYTDLVVGDVTRPNDASRTSVHGLPDGVMAEASFGPDGRRVAMTVSSRTTGTNVHVVDLDQQRQRRWTDVTADGLDPERFVAPELISYESFDGVEVPAFYSTPPGTTEDDEVPVVVDIHGGPEHQRRPTFNDTVQCFLDHGYAVFEPNVRGSTGYGPEYAALDDGRKRMDAIRDVRQGVKWLQERPEVDSEKIVGHGASYGGFVALLAAAEFPSIWRAIVEIAGITDLVTFLETTGEWRRDSRQAEYGSPDEDREFLRSISPVHNVDRIEAPVLAVHGKNDKRVPLSETEQFIRNAEEHGLEIQTLLLEGQGHQLRSLDARVGVYQTVLEFLDRVVHEN